MHWLGDHTSLILLPLAPIFALAPHPLTLLAMQTLALGLGAWPLYRLARRELPAGPLPVVAAALYLLHPALGYLNLFEMHPEIFAVPLLIWLGCELRAQRTRLALIAATLALMAREDVAFVVIGLALIVGLAERPRRPGLALALGALAVGSLALTFGVLHPMLLKGEATYGRMYNAWGDTTAEMLRNMVTHPIDLVSALWDSPGDARDTLIKRQYWAQMFGPLLALPLLAPLWLVPLVPIFFEHMLSNRVYQHSISYQYTALVLPMLCLAAVLGARRLLGWLGGARPSAAAAGALAVLLLTAGLTAQRLWGAVIGTGRWQEMKRSEQIWPDSLERTLRPYRDRMLARVPRQGEVVAGFEFLSHLALRPEVHSLHSILNGTYNYSNRPYPIPKHAVALLGDISSLIPYYDFHSGERLREVIAGGDLKPADAAAGTILMLRGATDRTEFFKVGDRWDLPRLNLLADGQLLFLGAVRRDSIVAPGEVMRIESYWRRVAPANRTYLSQVWLMQHGDIALYGRSRMLCYGVLLVPEWPRDTIVRETYHLLIPSDMPPGTYRPVFRLIAMDSTKNQVLPIVHVGDVTEPMNLVGLGDVVITPEKHRR
jgi:hypothetical protein